MTLSGRPKQAILGSKTGHFEPFWAILGSNVLKMACFRPVLEGFLEGPEWVDLGSKWVKMGPKVVKIGQILAKHRIGSKWAILDPRFDWKWGLQKRGHFGTPFRCVSRGKVAQNRYEPFVRCFGRVLGHFGVQKEAILGPLLS